MTTELSTAFPENGGFVIWAKTAWGAPAGGMAGWLQFVSTAVDAALYPAMFVSYVTAVAGMEFSDLHQGLMKGAFALVLVLLNLAGLDAVGTSSMIMLVLLLFPYVLIICIATGGIMDWTVNPRNWLVVLPQSDWGSFVNVLLWNMGMWEAASVCAGEVSNVNTVYPRAIGVVVILVVLNYMLPILAFTALDDNWSNYTNGYYIDLIRALPGGVFLAVLLGLSQCISAMGLFTNAVAKNTYLVCGMGEQGILPRLVAARLPYCDTPWVAVAVTLVIVGFMMAFGDFHAILGVDMIYYCLNLLLEIASLLRLRAAAPHLPRPYRIPLSGPALWALFAPPAALCAAVVALADPPVLVVSVAIMVLGVVVLLAVDRLRRARPEWFTGVAGVAMYENDDL